MSMHPSMVRLYDIAKINTPGELAKALNVSHARVTNWQRRGLSLDGAKLAAKRFRCSANYLLGDEEDTVPEDKKYQAGVEQTPSPSANESTPGDPYRVSVLPASVTLDLPARCITVWEDLQSLSEIRREIWINELSKEASEARLAKLRQRVDNDEGPPLGESIQKHREAG